MNRQLKNSTTLIELAPPSTENQPPVISNNEERQTPPRNQPLDFVDTVVTNIFSVAKQAGSTAKAIFNTLQALDEPVTPPVEEPKLPLVNTFNTSQTSTDAFFDRIEENSITTNANSISSKDQMQTLIEMGFANRVKNQRLLRENANDLAKVIELLTLDNNEDADWFSHRH